MDSCVKMGTVGSPLEAIYNFMCLGPLAPYYLGLFLLPSLPMSVETLSLTWLLALGRSGLTHQVGPNWFPPRSPKLDIREKSSFLIEDTLDCQTWPFTAILPASGGS